MIAVDTLVRGKAGVTDRIVTGRVYNAMRSGAVAIIGENDGRQWIINSPEPIGDPRPVSARRDIPSRLQ